MIQPLLLPAPVRSLETDGPVNRDATVHYTFGTYRPVLSFEEWKAAPERQKERTKSPCEIEFESARRAYFLASTLQTDDPAASRAIREILWRMRIAVPFCDNRDI